MRFFTAFGATRLVSTTALLMGALAVCNANAQQTQRDVLAGHITGPSGPLPGAMVSVTPVGAPAGTTPQVARSDIEGRWLIAVQEGPGEYTVRVTAIGMVPKTTTAKRGEPRKPIIVDVKLEAAPVALETVRVVEARRPRPPRQEMQPDRV